MVVPFKNCHACGRVLVYTPVVCLRCERIAYIFTHDDVQYLPPVAPSGHENRNTMEQVIRTVVADSAGNTTHAQNIRHENAESEANSQIKSDIQIVSATVSGTGETKNTGDTSTSTDIRERSSVSAKICCICSKDLTNCPAVVCLSCSRVFCLCHEDAASDTCQDCCNRSFCPATRAEIAPANIVSEALRVENT